MRREGSFLNMKLIYVKTRYFGCIMVKSEGCQLRWLLMMPETSQFLLQSVGKFWPCHIGLCEGGPSILAGLIHIMNIQETKSCYFIGLFSNLWKSENWGFHGKFYFVSSKQLLFYTHLILPLAVCYPCIWGRLI